VVLAEPLVLARVPHTRRDVEQVRAGAAGPVVADPHGRGHRGRRGTPRTIAATGHARTAMRHRTPTTTPYGPGRSRRIRDMTSIEVRASTSSLRAMSSSHPPDRA